MLVEFFVLENTYLYRIAHWHQRLSVSSINTSHST